MGYHGDFVQIKSSTDSQEVEWSGDDSPVHDQRGIEKRESTRKQDSAQMSEQLIGKNTDGSREVNLRKVSGLRGMTKVSKAQSKPQETAIIEVQNK